MSGIFEFSCTVVVTCFNSANTLRRTLESIVNQEPVSATEVIIVDDASTDESVKIASEFPFRLVENDRNLGSGACKALGSSLSKTPFVAFLDSDDVWDPNFLNTQRELWEQNRDSGAIGLSLRVENGRRSRAFETRRLLNDRIGGTITTDQLWKRNPFTSSALVYSHEKLEAAGGYSRFSPVDDFDTLVRLHLRNHKLLLFPVYSGVYGISDNQVTAQLSHQLMGQIRTYDLLSTCFSPDEREFKLNQKKLSLWINSIAKCANYSLGVEHIPNSEDLGIGGRGTKLFLTALKFPGVWKVVSILWRAWGRIKNMVVKTWAFLLPRVSF